MARELDAYGNAVLPKILTVEECQRLATLYENPKLFRSRVVMGRHGFGCGEYQYFEYPLPPTIAALRTLLFARR